MKRKISQVLERRGWKQNHAGFFMATDEEGVLTRVRFEDQSAVVEKKKTVLGSGKPALVWQRVQKVDLKSIEVELNDKVGSIVGLDLPVCC